MFGGSYQERIQMAFLQIVPFFMAIVFHEFGHGWMAKKWGDRTAVDSGRLTLNPAAHIDPIGTLLIPLFNMVTGIPLMFGWAKPVPINPTRFRNYRKGLFWVSVAGPSANILLAFLTAFTLVAFMRWLPDTFIFYKELIGMTKVAVQINLALAFFNLLPLPPLDGARMVESFLGYNATQKMRVLESYSFIILMVLLWSGVLDFLGGPILYFANFFTMTAFRVIALI